jgi:hypothetical protein
MRIYSILRVILAAAPPAVIAATLALSSPASGVAARSAEPGPDARAASGCPIQRRLAATVTLPRPCKTILSDTAGRRNPLRKWGRIDCLTATRVDWIRRGGDRRRQGDGSRQGNRSFRRLSVIDGDNVSGERCELGLNDQDGPTAVYREGQRRITFASIRLPSSSPVTAPNWRVVLQMKQAQPYYNPYGASMFELQARAGKWVIVNDWNDVWTAPAQQNTWTRFAFDIVYSQNPSIGSIKVFVDRNGDGDARDEREQSPRVLRQTLKPEVAGGPSPVPVGQSIPSHLRTGIYEDSIYSCPWPLGCSVDIDNVQVVKP